MSVILKLTFALYVKQDTARTTYRHHEINKKERKPEHVAVNVKTKRDVSKNNAGQFLFVG